MDQTVTLTAVLTYSNATADSDRPDDYREVVRVSFGETVIAELEPFYGHDDHIDYEARQRAIVEDTVAPIMTSLFDGVVAARKAVVATSTIYVEHIHQDRHPDIYPPVGPFASRAEAQRYVSDRLGRAWTVVDRSEITAEVK